MNLVEYPTKLTESFVKLIACSMNLVEHSSKLVESSMSFRKDSMSFRRDSRSLPKDSMNFGKVSRDFEKDPTSFAMDSGSFRKLRMSFARDSTSFRKLLMSSARDSRSFGKDSMKLGKLSRRFGRDFLSFARDSTSFKSNPRGQRINSLGPRTAHINQVRYLLTHRTALLSSSDSASSFSGISLQRVADWINALRIALSSRISAANGMAGSLRMLGAQPTLNERGRFRLAVAQRGTSWGAVLRDLVGAVGAQFIYLLIRLFGRVAAPSANQWLIGPIGGESIGDSCYQQAAEAEGLEIERNSASAGLVPDFDALSSATFNPQAVHVAIRDFYEHTASYRLDAWATTHFPANIALWALVITISRKVDQLNFPLDGLDTAEGITNEIILLRERSGAVRYTGWLRKLQRAGRVLYSGFYSTVRLPLDARPHIKVVFPMPDGNATVLLRPENAANGGLLLTSIGLGWGGAGFYRVQRRSEDALRVWHVTTLHETFSLYLDEEGRPRCDHAVRFLGLPVLTLHYRIERMASPSVARWRHVVVGPS